MKKFLFTQYPDEWRDISSLLDIVDINTFGSSVPKEWNNYSGEYLPYKICDSLADSNNLIILDYSINTDLIYLLAHHFISSEKGKVYFISNTKKSFDYYVEDYGLLKVKAIRLISSEILKELCSHDNSELKRYCSIYDQDFNYELYKNNYQKSITVDSHQVTNEWGAIKLLLNYGLTLDNIQTNYNIPYTVLFKQKLREFGISSTSTINLTGYKNTNDLSLAKAEFQAKSTNIKNVLLIDDNAKRGWEFALQQIFSSAKIEVKLNYEDALLVDFSKYDMIFLDLRLPLNATNNIPDIANGKELISKIKRDEKSLHVSLIIFTASQKARTLDAILEAGADGMYVKESINYSSTDSLDNYYDFLKEINYQQKKREHLKNYWQVIVKIKNSFLSEIVDNPQTLLKSRIIERLDMFYGLIKQQYEQSDYSTEMFHYSADKLSFITLWSILNEIQECYYNKIKSTINIIWNNTARAYNPLKRRDRSDFEYISEWHIKGQPTDKYFDKNNISIKTNASGGFKTLPNGNYMLDSNTNCFLSYKNSGSFYSTRNASGQYQISNTFQPEQKLSFQIAFLLLEKSDLKCSSHLNDYLKILKDSNDHRNKLYITHGEEENASFHSALERQKPTTPKITFDLFRLVTFLLTADDSII